MAEENKRMEWYDCRNIILIILLLNIEFLLNGKIFYNKSQGMKDS